MRRRLKSCEDLGNSLILSKAQKERTRCGSWPFCMWLGIAGEWVGRVDYRAQRGVLRCPAKSSRLYRYMAQHPV
ncbi:protein of unknown function [Stenotrophomonas maltophilia]|nr:protein of unknown function [Stenotrophomonas maltophilia]